MGDWQEVCLIRKPPDQGLRIPRRRRGREYDEKLLNARETLQTASQARAFGVRRSAFGGCASGLASSRAWLSDFDGEFFKVALCGL